MLCKDPQTPNRPIFDIFSSIEKVDSKIGDSKSTAVFSIDRFSQRYKSTMEQPESFSKPPKTPEKVFSFMKSSEVLICDTAERIAFTNPKRSNKKVSDFDEIFNSSAQVCSIGSFAKSLLDHQRHIKRENQEPRKPLKKKINNFDVNLFVPKLEPVTPQRSLLVKREPLEPVHLAPYQPLKQLKLEDQVSVKDDEEGRQEAGGGDPEGSDDHNSPQFCLKKLKKMFLPKMPKTIIIRTKPGNDYFTDSWGLLLQSGLQTGPVNPSTKQEEAPCSSISELIGVPKKIKKPLSLRYTCQYCGEVFSSHHELGAHVFHEHLKGKLEDKTASGEHFDPNKARREKRAAGGFHAAMIHQINSLRDRDGSGGS